MDKEPKDEIGEAIDSAATERRLDLLKPMLHVPYGAIRFENDGSVTEVTYLNDDEPQRADVELSHMAFAIRHHGSRGAHASGSGRGRE